jgi:hypothetical protein
MVRFYKEENWLEIMFAVKPNKRYAVSDLGRILSFTDKMNHGKLLKGSLIQGYPSLKCRIEGREKTLYVHKLVAQYFIKRKDKSEIYVIHLDYYKKNNKVENLKWADKDSMYAHQQKNPTVIKAREKQARYKPQTGHKLSSTDVMRIKKKIWDPRRKTRLKLIASQFDISEMQLYRIKSGENWSHVRVPNEPESTRQKSKVY